MDQGIQGRLKNPAGLQVYSDLGHLTEISEALGTAEGAASKGV